jgi:serine/threonine protein kinase
MGEVYRARDVRLKRQVALKMLPPVYAAGRDRIERFEREARAAAAINHPNICPLYEVGEHDRAVGNADVGRFSAAYRQPGLRFRRALRRVVAKW